ncbi:MAG: transcription-repair coupling factor [Victivallaceae bacterium]
MQKQSRKNWQKKVLAYLKTADPPANVLANVDPEAAAPPLLRAALAAKSRPMAVLCADLATAEELFVEAGNFNRELGLNLRLRLLPETVRGKLLVSGGEVGRARVLLETLTSPPDLVIGSVHAVLAAAPKPEKTRQAEFTIRPGERISPGQLLRKLVELDYDDELEVSIPGEFSHRGGIVDIFSPAQEFPCRIEFFGDEIDTLRRFQVDTQCSTGTIESYTVIAPHPSSDAARETGERYDFFDYLDEKNASLAALHPRHCREHLEKYSGPAATDRFDAVTARYAAAGRLVTMLDHGETSDRPAAPPGCFPPLAHLADHLPDEARFGAIELMRELLLNQLRQWVERGYQVILTAANPESRESLEKFCRTHGLDAEAVEIVEGRFASGAFFPDQKLVLLNDRELFTVNAFCRNGADQDEELPDREPAATEPEWGENRLLGELDEGDYAVHLAHGIAIFRGIVESTGRDGVRREAIKLEFRDGALLLVPLSQAGLVSRYLGAPGKVKLHALGASRWSSEKASAGRAVRSYAADMLRFQAVREASPGIAFPPNPLEMQFFEAAFPYQETPDQRRSTDQITADMEQPRPMDRLLCGDVGYGKTEIAMRAAFKAVASGYQVAVLAPTTVLAEQHFYSFRERFAEYPYVIEHLSRFRTASEQASVIARLKSGGVDIVIGTHRLCNKSIEFANLGLLVIDEEQRFGVKHKEQLRRRRTELDVLTMSATPIPRTLYLAMAGARDLSTLQTAPRRRLPVKTIIAPEDPVEIANAIRAERERGGQIYYLHNRVRTIEGCRDKLAKLLPGVRFGIAHGQMDEDELARSMRGFLDGSIDCLVCSTIIESGLDIPNANTIIIERADRFGLAELYQLRGRVGRRNHQAYAYMLLPKSELITSDARKRIAAIRRCSQLGAGFQLALRDLEIRGAGNILGSEQSGHLNSIGFDLYCRLLKAEVARLKGEEPEFLAEAEVALDFVVYGFEAPPEVLAAGFPPSYLTGVRPRLAAYRRLATLTSEAALDNFRSELIDRYGKLPEAAENLLAVTRLRILTALAKYDSLTVAEGKILLQSGRGIYRDRGRVPTVDPANPPQLKLAVIRKLVRKALEESKHDA